jgi:hypothetical protein
MFRRLLVLSAAALACTPAPSSPRRAAGGEGGEEATTGGSGSNTGGVATGGKAGSTGGNTGTGGALEPSGGTGGSARPDAAGDTGGAAPPDAGAGPDLASADPGACARMFSAGVQSPWVHHDASGKLVYKALDARGDRIMDFSAAGYRGGGVAIPDVPVQQTVGPSGGADDTAAIQAAIDAVAKRPLTGGLRGAVLLMPGVYKVSGSIRIDAAGVVLRGSGSGAGGTEIQITGPSHNLFNLIGPSGQRQIPASPVASITDAYVPSGARSFTVADAGGFAVGDEVLVRRPVTDKWIQSLGMDVLVRDGAPQTWLKAGTTHDWERVVTAIDGKKITVDIPLSDSFDAAMVSPPGATMVKYSFPRISQVGIERLRATSPPRSADLENYLIRADNFVDGWVRDVTGHNFTRGVIVQPGVKRMTVEDVVLTHDFVDYKTSAAPFDFSINATEVLIQRSSSTGGNTIWFFATQNYARGPNVVLEFKGAGLGHIAPHQRWASGLLLDNASSERGIILGNNGTAGDGYGWDIAWAVAWNCVSSTDILAPPGAMNWAIGCQGSVSAAHGTSGLVGSPLLPKGINDSQNMPVAPRSLYLAQLCERLGPQALANIGWK